MIEQSLWRRVTTPRFSARQFPRHVDFAADQRLSDLIKRFGRRTALHAWQGGAIAIDVIETHVEELDIDCGFHRVPGFLHSALFGDTDECASLNNEFEAANELGFAATFHPNGPIQGTAAVSYADQAIFHPLACVYALARAAGRRWLVRHHCLLCAGPTRTERSHPGRCRRASLIRTGHRDQRWFTIHRANDGASIHRDGIRRQWSDVRAARRHDGA